MSIKPEFAERIFDGTKRYEFRKAVYANRAVQTVVVYVTQPVGRIVGEFDVDGIVEAAPECLWAETHAHAGVTRDFFDAYFEGRDRAFAIQVGEVRLYDAPLVPGDVIANFTAPQSYMYVDDRLSRPAPEARQLALLK
ncbi:ASCH domain-containing protein [Roseomonas mucosa]|uniref:ASCH domain-containing protein n=1 Tax=Roseomonas mucosa TaxID=207340 RepID=UPI002AF6C5A6|nr:ASCH domain-containing protein [Roseomonas mucosa]